MLKNFMTWVLAPDRFPTTRDVPPQVSWITCHVKARDKKRLDRKDLLTPEDIEKLLAIIHKRLAQHLNGEAPLHPALATTTPSSAVTPSNTPSTQPGPPPAGSSNIVSRGIPPTPSVGLNDPAFLS